MQPRLAVARIPIAPGDDAVIERVVDEVNTLYRVTTLSFALRVGRLIVDTFYGGDLEEWRKRGAKTMSFRRLARHPGIEVSPTVLYRAVAIYELAQRVGADGWQHISPTHMRLVLPLPAEHQGRLLGLADREQWSVARFRRELSAMKLERDRRGGRRSHGPLRKALDHLGTSVSLCAEALSTEGAQDLSPESARSALELLRELRRAAAALEQRVNRQMDGATTDPPPSWSAPASQ
ncbi:MAG TPA: hypothetical protein VGI39_25175 [Polyangiaceae bacterium]